jgi:hypothetical protein
LFVWNLQFEECTVGMRVLFLFSLPFPLQLCKYLFLFCSIIQKPHSVLLTIFIFTDHLLLDPVLTGLLVIHFCANEDLAIPLVSECGKSTSHFWNCQFFSFPLRPVFKNLYLKKNSKLTGSKSDYREFNRLIRKCTEFTKM